MRWSRRREPPTPARNRKSNPSSSVSRPSNDSRVGQLHQEVGRFRQCFGAHARHRRRWGEPPAVCWNKTMSHRSAAAQTAAMKRPPGRRTRRISRAYMRLNEASRASNAPLSAGSCSARPSRSSTLALARLGEPPSRQRQHVRADVHPDDASGKPDQGRRPHGDRARPRSEVEDTFARLQSRAPQNTLHDGGEPGIHSLLVELSDPVPHADLPLEPLSFALRAHARYPVPSPGTRGPLPDARDADLGLPRSVVRHSATAGLPSFVAGTLAPRPSPRRGLPGRARRPVRLAWRDVTRRPAARRGAPPRSWQRPPR